MKVKFNRDGLWYLTKDKIYNVVNENLDEYLIKTDKGFEYWYPKEFFEVVEED